MIYDQNCRGRPWFLGLSHAWSTGAWLYRSLGRFDGWQGVSSWEEAISWLLAYEPSRLIGEIQFWGHGKWGCAKIGPEILDISALRPTHPLQEKLIALRARLAAKHLWWFRSCETFGTQAGHDFAQHWSDFFGSHVAGHTYEIGVWQSGLHCLAPGKVPGWSLEEGLLAGTPERPQKSKTSSPKAPNTVHFLTGKIPLRIIRND